MKNLFLSNIPSYQVHHCLAIEDYLLNQPDDRLYLIFWVSDRAVVIGKNQNPWKEVSFLNPAGRSVDLARRVSGGGTVYHDRGNLNYSFIVPRKKYDADLIFAIVLGALAKIGIKGYRTKTNDLTSHEKKFSGSAFAFKREKVLHHGTLLVDADLDMMSLLDPDIRCIKCNATSSRKRAVVNLKSINTLIDHDAVMRSIAGHAAELFKLPLQSRSIYDFVSQSGLNKLERKHRSWQWLYGRTPDFIGEMWREKLGLRFSVSKGIINRLYSLPENVLIPVMNKRVDMDGLLLLLEANKYGLTIDQINSKVEGHDEPATSNV